MIIQTHEDGDAERAYAADVSAGGTRRSTQGERVHCPAEEGVHADGGVVGQSQRDCQSSAVEWMRKEIE